MLSAISYKQTYVGQSDPHHLLEDDEEGYRVNEKNTHREGNRNFYTDLCIA